MGTWASEPTRDDSPKIRTAPVVQDGNCFYLDGNGRAIKAPFVVKDMDMHAAERARRWFMKWCENHGINPDFGGY